MFGRIQKASLLVAVLLGTLTQAAPTNGTLEPAATTFIGLTYRTNAGGTGTCTTRDLTGFELQNIYVGDAFNDQISFIRVNALTSCTFWMDFIRGPNICGGSSFSYASPSPINDLGNYKSAFNDQISCFACQ